MLTKSEWCLNRWLVWHWSCKIFKNICCWRPEDYHNNESRKWKNI